MLLTRTDLDNCTLSLFAFEYGLCLWERMVLCSGIVSGFSTILNHFTLFRTANPRFGAGARAWEIVAGILLKEYHCTG